MIALHFPETFLAVVERMYTDHYKLPQLQKDHRRRGDQTTFVSIQIGTTSTAKPSTSSSRQVQVNNNNNKLNFSSMKFFDRFRKIVMRLLFSSVPSSSSGRGGGGGNRAGSGAAAQRRRSCDRPETPKSSCSSSSYYYSSNSHYHEAIADCIEFFNKSSSQEAAFAGRRSDAVV